MYHATKHEWSTGLRIEAGAGTTAVPVRSPGLTHFLLALCGRARTLGAFFLVLPERAADCCLLFSFWFSLACSVTTSSY
jgi:hypothetical protein